MTDENTNPGIPKGLMDMVRTEMADHIRIDDAISAELKHIYKTRIEEINEWKRMMKTMERGDRPMSPMQQLQAEAVARLIILYNIHLLQGRHMEDKFPDGFDKESPADSTAREGWLMFAGQLKFMIDSLKDIRLP